MSRSSPILRTMPRCSRELDANNGGTTLELRKKLAAKAFALTAAYDSTISQWFAFADQGERWPETWTRASRLKMPLRYGENPHQQAALYLPVGPHARGIAQAEQVQGKELSYNNLNDANAALELVSEFRDGEPTVVIVKHANPCGVASRATLDRCVERGARLRQRLGLRRNRRDEPPARCRDRRGDHRDLHRGRRRARCRRGGEGDLREEEESAAAADRRASRSGSRPGQTIAVIAGGILVQDRDNGMVTRDAAQMRDEAPADRAGSSPTACSPGPSPSTSSRTRSSMPRTGSPPASAPAR